MIEFAITTFWLMCGSVCLLIAVGIVSMIIRCITLAIEERREKRK